MLYQKEAQGDWGRMQNTETCVAQTEMLSMADGTQLFLRSWVTDSSSVLLILHGLGAHSGWFIDMGGSLSTRGLTVYAVDHRGFGRSGGLAGHIDNYQTYVDDCAAVLAEIRTRHPGARVFVLGHSMGGIFTTHLAAKDGDKLAGMLYLNPWIKESTSASPGTLLAVLAGGLLKSKRLWGLTGGPDVMTTNPGAVEMLNADPHWRRAETASFFLQIQRMRMPVLKLAKSITLPALVMQAGEDKSILASGSRTLYEALGSHDKTWKTYPGYAHDSEFEADRTQMDGDIAAWIREHHA
jgi:alpha-beta hydrolase superfamily lysophospholipase